MQLNAHVLHFRYRLLRSVRLTLLRISKVGCGKLCKETVFMVSMRDLAALFAPDILQGDESYTVGARSL